MIWICGFLFSVWLDYSINKMACGRGYIYHTDIETEWDDLSKKNTSIPFSMRMVSSIAFHNCSKLKKWLHNVSHFFAPCVNLSTIESEAFFKYFSFDVTKCLRKQLFSNFEKETTKMYDLIQFKYRYAIKHRPYFLLRSLKGNWHDWVRIEKNPTTSWDQGKQIINGNNRSMVLFV